MSFPRYPKYKSSGVEWLGEVPVHWETTALKRFCETITDGAHISPETENGVFPFVSTKDVGEDGIDLEGCLRTSASTFDYMVKTGCQPGAGDVLFSKDGTIGRTIVVGEHQPFVVASSLIIIRPERALLSSRFLHFLCQSNPVGNQVESVVKGAGLPRLSIQNLVKVLGCFPPLTEQTRIAEFLDGETSKIDGLVAEQRRLMELLKEKRQAVISHAVTRGLNPKAPLKPSGIEWLGDVPAHWEVKQLGYLCSKIGSGKTPLGGAEAYSDEGILFIRSQNVYDEGLFLDDVVYVTEAIDAEQPWSRVLSGDILLNITGASLGRTCLVPGEFERANVNQHVCILRLFDPKQREYVAMVLKSSWMKAQFDSAQTGAAREGLNFTQISKLVLAVPPESEQIKITEYLHQQTAQLDTLTAEAQRAIDLLQERRTALISAAVTGQIDVRQADVR